MYRDVAQSREATPTDEDMLEYYIRDAYKYHDLLLEMGGRPTRAVLKEPTGKAIYEHDEIRIVDDRGELHGTIAPNENLTVHHWIKECARFEEELDRWQKFRDYQQVTELEPLLKASFDPENTDQRLVKILVGLNDWREFQYYLQAEICRVTVLTWKSTRHMESIMREEATSDEPAASPGVQNGLEICYRQVFPQQVTLENLQIQLAWAESQILEILAEACSLLEAACPLQRQLEMKLEKQVNALNQELMSLEARPDCLTQAPHQSAGLAQRIDYWGSEMTRLMAEHWEWKMFLAWRKPKPYTEESTKNGEQETNGRLSDLQIWVDHVAYRKYQLDRTRSWVAGWVRLQRLRENDINTTTRDRGLSILENTISQIQAYVKKFQQDIHTAELQVRSAEQHLAKLSSQRFSPATVRITQQSDKHPQLPLSPPGSELTDSIPEDPKIVSLSSSPTQVHRLRGSSKSHSNGIPDWVKSSNVPKKGRRTRAVGKNINKRQPATVADVVAPDQAVVDNEIRMRDAPDYPYPGEAVGEGEGAESTDRPTSDIKDTLMADIQAPVNDCSPVASEVNSKSRGTRIFRRLPSPTEQALTSRKTRPAKKLEISSRVLKNLGKKPARKTEAFTDQQTTALLSAAFVKDSPKGSLPPRRSQRLKEKAANPPFQSPPKVDVTETSHSPEQKKPKVLVSPQKSRQKEPEMPSNAVGPSRPSR